jgi:4-amino-4-deoxy-L-arabinose transferase-like glycosyltransferase
MPSIVLPDNKVESAARNVSAGFRPSFIFALSMVLVCAAFLWLAFAISWTKFSRAEIFFAECAREMVAFNNMVTPLYQGKPFFDKPIFVYWSIVAMYKTFGVSHLAARVPSMVASLATVSLTAFITRAIAREKRDAAGLVAAMCLSSSFMFFSFAYLCMSDMFLVLFDSITMTLLYLGLNNDRRRTALWLSAAVSMGFAFITKGPVGVVLPAAAMLIFTAATRRLSLIKWYHVICGALIVAIIAVPWFFAAYQANGTWALAWFFIRENFQRYAGSTYDTHKPLWFMVASLMSGFLPWSVFLPFAFVGMIKRFRSGGFMKTLSEAGPTGFNQRLFFLWTWLAVVTAFFSLSRGKCDYYVLPIYPAAAVITAIYITEQSGKWSRAVALVIGGLVLVAGIASPLLLSSVAINSTMAEWWLMPVVLIIFGSLALAAAASERLIACIVAIFCAICFGGAGFAFQMLPAVGEAQSFDLYANAMKNTPAYTQIGVHKDLGHWVDELTFQVERNPIELSDSKSISDFFASGPGIALIPQSAFDTALADSPALRDQPLRVLDRRMVASHPLTPGYVLQRHGNLYDTTLLLVSNQ